MRLAQVVDNLLTNAVKFTPRGGTVTVTVTAARPARLEVADTGVGIPADEVDRLFERFFRASTASTEPGTGLGLSIVKSIAEATAERSRSRATRGSARRSVELPC